MIQILADKAIPFLCEMFSDSAKVNQISASSITNEACKSADVLVVRSITRVTAQLLEGTPIKLVASATIGTDHIDIVGLDNLGIQVVNVPGCNSEAVVQHVLSSLSVWSLLRGKRLVDLAVGIVGMGNIGSRLAGALDQLGVNWRASDPLRRETGWNGHQPLDELTRTCDVISFHTPLTTKAPYATKGLINEHFLNHFNGGKLIVNTARGAIVDKQAIDKWLGLNSAIFDVWPEEPLVDAELLNHVFCGTPHVAGYSLEGKLRASVGVYEAVCQFFALPIESSLEKYKEPPELVDLENCSSIEQVLLKSYQPMKLNELMQGLAKHSSSIDITQLRNNYKLRRDYSGQNWSHQEFETIRQELVESMTYAAKALQ